MMRRGYLGGLAVTVCVLVALSACGGSQATSAPSGGSSGATSAPAGGSAATTVNAQEKDFSIALDKSSVPAGSITFKMTNMGPSAHNIGVITPDGASKASGVTGMPIKMGNPINAGQSQSITVDLKPGMYSVICTVPGHVQLGMIVPFTVT